MKKIAIILSALILVSFLFVSCRKAKEPEGKKEVQVQQAQKEEVKQPTETKPEVQPQPATPTAKEEKPQAMEPSPLTEKEQKYVEKIGNGPLITPNAFKSQDDAIKYLKILLKGNHRNVRFFTRFLDKERSQDEYGIAIGSALSVLDPRKKEIHELFVKVLEEKKDYPSAVSRAIKRLKGSGDKRVIELEYELIKHPDADVRLEAAGALLIGGYGDAALPVLDELVEKEDTRALSHLITWESGKRQSLIDSRGLAILEKAVKHPSPLIRLESAEILLELNKITKDQAEDIAICILNNLKDKTVKDYSLTFSPQKTYEIIALPDAKINTEETKKQYATDHRACHDAIHFLSAIDSKKSLTTLKEISQKNTDHNFVCEGKEASSVLAGIQMHHCIEPEFKRHRRPKGEKAYITSELGTIGLLSDDFLSSSDNFLALIGISVNSCVIFPLERFLESINIIVREVKLAQVSPSLVKDVPFLIIPSGALATIPSADYENFKLYAKNGGILLVLSQPKGKNYSKLMEGVEAVGYEEDRTQNYQEVMIFGNQLMFAGIPKKVFVMSADGYFKKYPEKVKVYLKRANTGQAIFLSYPIGKGEIIATTSFTPESFDDGRATEDETIFFRELINYFELPMNLQTVKAGQDAKIKIKVTNEDKTDKATKAVVMIYDPEKAYERYRKEFAIELKPGGSTFIGVIYPTCATAMPGIWHVKYELLYQHYEQEVNMSLESLLQPPREALDGRFTVIK